MLAEPSAPPILTAPSDDTVDSTIAMVGRMVLRDIAASSDLDDQRARTGLGNLLRRALPLSQLDAGALKKPGLAAEFLPYVGGFDAYTAALRTTSTVGSQQKALMVAVVQATGSGKTRLAYADGQRESLVVLARVQKQKGSFTPVWEEFMQLGHHWESALPWLGEDERRLVSLSALATMRLLAACHVMYVARVLRCVASSPPASVTDPTSATQREAALRCLRNGRGGDAVAALYRAQLAALALPRKLPLQEGKVLSAPGGGAQGEIEVCVLDPAAVDAFCAAANAALRDQLWPGAQVVLWWDEAHALLSNRTPKLFSPSKLFAAGGSADVAEMQDCFYGLTAACADLCDSSQLAWLQALCGTWLELSTRVSLPDISPLRGRVTTVFHASRISVQDMLGMLTQYMQLNDDTVKALRPHLEAMQGRPIFFYSDFLDAFWQSLPYVVTPHHASSSALPAGNPTAPSLDAAALRELLVGAARSSVHVSRMRMATILDGMWKNPGRHVGRMHPTLIVELYAALRMNRGVVTLSHDAGSEALRHGLLALPLSGTPQADNLRFDETQCQLEDEPISADAIRFLVDAIVKRNARNNPNRDPIFQLLSESLASGGSAGFKFTTSVKGPVLEIAFAWHVLRRVLLRGDARPSLHDILAPLAAPGFQMPGSAAQLVVASTVRGASCDDALRGGLPTDLHLLGSHTGQELVLTNIATAAGADVVFTVFSSQGAPVAVFVQAKAQQQASLRDCLRAASPAWQYTDEPQRDLALAGKPFKSSIARAAYEQLAASPAASGMLAAAHRVALSATGFKPSAVEFVNTLNRLPHGCERSPILLCQPTVTAFGARLSKQLIAECSKSGHATPTSSTAELAYLLPQSVADVTRGAVIRSAPATRALKDGAAAADGQAGGKVTHRQGRQVGNLETPDKDVLRAVTASRARGE